MHFDSGASGLFTSQAPESMMQIAAHSLTSSQSVDLSSASKPQIVSASSHTVPQALVSATTTRSPPAPEKRRVTREGFTPPRVPPWRPAGNAEVHRERPGEIEQARSEVAGDALTSNSGGLRAVVVENDLRASARDVGGIDSAALDDCHERNQRVVEDRDLLHASSTFEDGAK